MERRIQATAVCSVLSDFHAWMTQTPVSERFAKNLDSPLVKAIVRARNLRPSLILLDTYAWRWGAIRYADMLDVTKDFTLDPARRCGRPVGRHEAGRRRTCAARTGP